MPVADFRQTLRRAAKFAAHSRFVQGTFALQVGGGIQRLVAFATHLMLARGLGSETYGEYVLVVSLAGILPFVFDTGVRRAVLTRLSAHQAEGAAEQQAAVLTAAFKLSTAAASASIVIGFLALPWLGSALFDSRSLGVLAWFLLWGKLTGIPFQLLNMTLEASRNMKSVFRLDVASESGRLFAVGLAVVLGWRLPGLVATLVCLDILLGLMGVVLITRLWHRGDRVIPAPTDLLAAWSSAPVMAILKFGFFASTGKRFEQGVRIIIFILLGSLATPAAAGFFRIAMAIGTLPVSLLSPVARNLLPTLSGHAASGNWIFFRQTLRRATVIAAGATTLAAGILAVLTPWILQNVYGGGAYLAALPAVQMVLLTTALIGFAVGHEAVYLATGDLTAYNIRNLAIMPLVLAPAPWIIATYGALGAAGLLLAGTIGALAFDFVRIWLRWSPPTACDGGTEG